eukprot:scaffold98150_cov102-Phaeocystis_antarctica.AAC.4
MERTRRARWVAVLLNGQVGVLLQHNAEASRVRLQHSTHRTPRPMRVVRPAGMVHDQTRRCGVLARAG